jgi:PmbA protein
MGADAAKIGTSVSFQRRLVVENKEFTLANSLESRGIAILVHKDMKKGSASLNSVDEAAVKQAVADALALAKYSVPDENLTLATPDVAPKTNALPFMYDEALAELDLEEMQGMMAETLARLTRDKRVALDRYEMACDVSWHGMYNSHGVRQAERQSIATWSFFGMGRDGEEVTGFDYDGSFSFGKNGLQAKKMEGAEAFTKKILGALKPRKAPSYKGAVLFSPRAVQELLFGMILYHAGGRQVMDGKSRWDKSVGQKVTSERLTLRDCPHDPRYSGATAFDGDGVPTKATTILSNGVLGLHLHDLYSAKKTGKKTSGHSGGPFALELATGNDTLASIYGAHENLLLVDRFSGNSDPIKGDFSGVAKSSRLIVKGQDAGGVTETMIAGNFFDLAQKVLAVSNVAENVSGSCSAPYVLVDGVSVTGS